MAENTQDKVTIYDLKRIQKNQIEEVDFYFRTKLKILDLYVKIQS